MDRGSDIKETLREYGSGADRVSSVSYEYNFYLLTYLYVLFSIMSREVGGVRSGKKSQ